MTRRESRLSWTTLLFPFFETTSPTRQQLKDCPRIELTSRRDWNPTKVSVSKASVEIRPKEREGLKEKLMRNLPRYINESTMQGHNMEDLPTRQTYTSTKQHKKATAELLADRFAIGIQQARDTMRATFQRAL